MFHLINLSFNIIVWIVLPLQCYCYYSLHQPGLVQQTSETTTRFSDADKPSINKQSNIYSKKCNTALYAKGLGSKGSDETFFCQECGVEHIKWVGKCTSCQTWNSVKSFRPTKQLFESKIGGGGSSRQMTSSWVSSPSTSSSSSSYYAPSTSSSQAQTASFYTSDSDSTSNDRSSDRYNSKQRDNFSTTTSFTSSSTSGTMRHMDSIEIDEEKSRILIPFSAELNRVLGGGGLVKGSVCLCAGEPGVGKSTLFMQIASSIASTRTSSTSAGTAMPQTVVYVSGEENIEQIVLRAKRLKLPTHNIFLLCDINVDFILESILNLPTKPTLIIIDSVQTMKLASCTSAPGSVSQIKESTAKFVQLAKTMDIAIMCLGHVTKSGEVAGPRVLEHMVDTVLFIEGEGSSSSTSNNNMNGYDSGSGSNSGSEGYRLLRTVKNRFGSTSEVGVFGMTATGMIDITNPSDLFLSNAIVSTGMEGSAATVLLQGTRPMMAEIQCLVGDFIPFIKSSPKRTSEGFSIQRLLLICAVIEKRLKLSLYNRDVYINVVGGLKISETSSDVAVAVALVSSLLSLRVKPAIAFIGEIGLNGEIRGGKKVEQRVSEAVSMGFKQIIVPATSSSSSSSSSMKSSSSSSQSTATATSSTSNSNKQQHVIKCATLTEVLKVALDGDFEAVIANKKKKYYKSSSSRNGKSASDTTKNNGDNSNSNNNKGRKLYSPAEEEWMTDDTDLLFPSYDDDDEDEDITE